MKRPFTTFNFSVQNASDNEVDIYIDGEIVDAETQAFMKAYWGDDTSTSFKSFREQVNAVDVKTYNVYINSGGGLVIDALAIHDLLKDIQNKGKTVNTIGRGIIASAATYILMAGNSRMSKNSWFMIHNVSGFAWGDVNEIERTANTLRQFNNRIRDFYVEATGQRKEEITKMMNAETWMTADEARSKNFIKEIDGEVAFTNLIPKENWQYNNMSVLNAYNASVKQPSPTPTNDINTLITNQFEDMKKFFTDIVNAIRGTKPSADATPETIVTNLADSIQAPFEKLGDEIEATITNKVTEVTGEAFVTDITNKVKEALPAPVVNFSEGDAKTSLEDAVKVAVENAVKPLSEKITNLETVNSDLKKKNEDLELEFTNLKGGKQQPKNEEGGEPPIGTWHRK